MPGELIDKKSMGDFEQELENQSEHGLRMMALFCPFVKAGKHGGYDAAGTVSAGA